MSEFKGRPQTGFIMVVTAASPPGVTLRQRLPLDPLRRACVDPSETVRIERRLYCGGKELRHDVSDLVLRNGAWVDGAAASYDRSGRWTRQSGAQAPKCRFSRR
jgi:hypothetical protein